MADCITSVLTEGFTSDCQNEITSGTNGGVWVFNLDDIESYTSTSEHGITDIVLKTGAQGFKFEMGAGGNAYRVEPTFEQAPQDQTDRAYTHSVVLSFSDIKTNTKNLIANFAQNNVVAVVENRQKTMEEGKFEIYGTDVGLRATATTRTANDIATGGFPQVTMTTQTNSYETNIPSNIYDTDVPTTRAKLDGYLTPTT